MRSERLPVATHRNGFGSFPRFWAVDVFLGPGRSPVSPPSRWSRSRPAALHRCGASSSCSRRSIGHEAAPLRLERTSAEAISAINAVSLGSAADGECGGKSDEQAEN